MNVVYKADTIRTKCDTCPIMAAGESCLSDKYDLCRGCDESIEFFLSQQTPDPTANVKEVTNDNVNLPLHYTQGGIECWDAMEAAFGKEEVKTFCKLNAFKYVWRSSLKNGMEDIKKARRYLDKFIELSGETNE